MSIRVCCGVIQPQGYSGDPVDTFTIYIPLKLFNTDGPQAEEDSLTVAAPVGVSAGALADMVYDGVVAKCQALSWAAPTRAEVFCIMPQHLQEVVPQF